MPKWLKWTLTLVLFVGLTLALYFIGFKGDWIKPLVQNAGIWGYILFALLQIIITTTMCFVPATTMTFTIMGVQIFGLLPGFLLTLSACWISSICMFFIGKYGGTRLVDWLIGKPNREKLQNQVSDRATVLIPIMLLCPFFPDDGLCMIAGVTKMRTWYFCTVCLLSRISCMVLTAFVGEGTLIRYILDTLGNNYVLWFIAINILLIDIYAIWKFSGKVEEFLKRRREKKNPLKENCNEKIEVDKTIDSRTDKDTTI